MRNTVLLISHLSAKSPRDDFGPGPPLQAINHVVVTKLRWGWEKKNGIPEESAGREAARERPLVFSLYSHQPAHSNSKEGKGVDQWCPWFGNLGRESQRRKPYNQKGQTPICQGNQTYSKVRKCLRPMHWGLSFKKSQALTGT